MNNKTKQKKNRRPCKSVHAQGRPEKTLISFLCSEVSVQAGNEGYMEF
jgi:hypothetical protein